MTFPVLVVVPIILAKQKELYMKGQLNMLGLIIKDDNKTDDNISTTAQVSNICLILRLCIAIVDVIIAYSKQ